MKQRGANRHWPVIGLAVIVALGLSLAACGSSSSSSSSSSGKPSTAENKAVSSGGDAEGNAVSAAEKIVAGREVEPTTISSAEFGPVTVKPGGSFYMVDCEPSIEGCSNIKKGVKAATEAVGYHYEECDQRSSSPESGNECFAHAVAAKPDAILVDGVGAVTAATGYEEARKAGIPVIAMFTGNEEGVSTTEIAAEETCLEVGEAQAQWAIAVTGGKADVLIPYSHEFTCTVQVYEGMEAVLEKCSTCTSTGLEFEIASVTTSLPQQIQAEILSDPEINVINGTFNVPPVIAAEVVQQLGKSDSIHIGGTFGAAANFEQIKSGEGQEADTSNGNREPGWVGVDAALRLMNGEKVPPKIPVNFMTLTAKNIAKFPNGFEGSANFESQFQKLWGIG
jgi:ribose transport system substrate-binding protein